MARYRWRPMDPAEVLDLYAEIQSAFPALEMTVNQRPEHVDLEMDIPRQEGLSFDVHLNLQGDELHLVAGEGFWLEWFPGHDPARKEAYRDAVTGLLSGRLRILEHRRGGRVLAADLQEPSGDEWRTIGWWSTLRYWFTFGARSQTVLRNGSP